MGQKEDIGQLFEKKLNQAKKIVNPSLWEKISASLEEENRRKKRMLFYWFIGGGITILLASLVLFGNKAFTIKQDSVPEVEHSKTLSENGNSENPLGTSEENPPVSNNETGEKLSRGLISADISDTININKDIPKQSIHTNRNAPRNNSRNKSAEENFTVSKNYYYYNSKNGKQFVTKNKEVIDSLISKQHHTSDTMVLKKENSTVD
jgi:hypothetical protein